MDLGNIYWIRNVIKTWSHNPFKTFHLVLKNKSPFTIKYDKATETKTGQCNIYLATVSSQKFGQLTIIGNTMPSKNLNIIPKTQVQPRYSLHLIGHLGYS